MEKPLNIDENNNITKFTNRLGYEQEYDFCVSDDYLRENKIKPDSIYTDKVYFGTGFITEVNGKKHKGASFNHYWRNK